MLALKGAMVTADAFNGQRAIAEQIVAQGGDYALALRAIKARCLTMWSCFSTIRSRKRAPRRQLSRPTAAASKNARAAQSGNATPYSHQRYEKEGSRGSLRSKFQRAGWDDDHLLPPTGASLK